MYNVPIGPQIVPRMFDLERQLLCFVLHEAVFLPALEASLHRPRSPPDSSTKAIADDGSGGTHAAVDQSTPPGEPTTKDLEGEGISNTAETFTTPSNMDTEDMTAPCGAGQDTATAAAAIEEWPQNGAWNVPGRGAGTGCGPGGSMDSSDVDGCSSAKMVEAALRAEAAAAEAAAIGVFQWQGGRDDGGVDTVSLLDCSLRR